MKLVSVAFGIARKVLNMCNEEEKTRTSSSDTIQANFLEPFLLQVKSRLSEREEILETK